MSADFRVSAVCSALLLLGHLPAAGQESAPIQDNSFLLEEAYNQEQGVVQHISTFSRPDRGGAWLYTFTQEWPLGGIRHQLSYTVPVLRTSGNGTGIGDVFLNYRYQLAGNSDSRLLFAPRASVLLPTGNEEKGRGTGEPGFQANLPLTYTPLPQFTTHWNAGVTLVRHTGTIFNLGGSVIWLARPSFNVVFEGLWLTSASEKAAFLNPGVRWAFDLSGGLQIVPGLAYTIGVGPSSGEDALFLYLSFEHPFKRL